MTWKALRCFLSGGHSWSWPKQIDGRMCQTCLTGCGATTTGWALTEPKQNVVAFENLKVIRTKTQTIRARRTTGDSTVSPTAWKRVANS